MDLVSQMASRACEHLNIHVDTKIGHNYLSKLSVDNGYKSHKDIKANAHPWLGYISIRHPQHSPARPVGNGRAPIPSLKWGR